MSSQPDTTISVQGYKGQKRGPKKKPIAFIENPDTRKAILEYIKAGNYIIVSCIACGVTNEQFYQAHKRADAGEEPYVQFFKEFKEAEANAEAAILETIKKASIKQWLPAAWLLERKFPERYSKTDRVDVSGTINHQSLLTISTKKSKIIEATLVTDPQQIGSALRLEPSTDTQSIVADDDTGKPL